MAITVNKNTTGSPITTTGALTGTQSIKFIAAPRVYVKTSDATPSVPVTKSNGSTPSGWTDLGIVAGNVKCDVTKKIAEVKTGLDNYLRAAYTDEKIGKGEFTMSQFDDVVFNKITGLTGSVVSAGSIYNYAVGSEDLTRLAVLFVVQNKLDGKEWQMYNPDAYLNFSVVDSGDELQLKCDALFPFFTNPVRTTAVEEYLSFTLFA